MGNEQQGIRGERFGVQWVKINYQKYFATMEFWRQNMSNK